MNLPAPLIVDDPLNAMLEWWSNEGKLHTRYIHLDSSRHVDFLCTEYLKSQGYTFPAIEKVGRNQPCPCGSDKKYKKCHGR